MKSIFLSYWRAFVDFLYPPVCKACGRPLAAGERTLCTDCRVHLPYTHYEDWNGNPTARAFYGRVPLQRAASVLFFTADGRVQSLLHALKYKHQPELGLYIGALMGRRLGRSPLYAGVDYIVPVPLHPAKLKKRGYNQAALLGQGMASAWPTGGGGHGAPAPGPELLTDLLLKRCFNESQTRKNRAERWDNVQAVYELNADADLRARVAGKHLLLVDDVMTTGATLESAASALHEGLPDVRLSVVTAATPA
ncbi:MAG: double zinc ribbon domain-containing protein [Bacteroidales bacterium]|nr:double zinc ribbon domain-containing protein [Bacteroidales bacterium]